MIRVSGMKWILKICVSFAVKYRSLKPFLHTILNTVFIYFFLNQTFIVKGFKIDFNIEVYPYLCFISLLYLDLYVLGDGALIS